MFLLQLFSLFTLTVGVFGDGEVVFLSKPPNIEFRGHEACDSDIVKDICSTSLGFTTYQTSEWSGLYINSPFNFAESVVVIAVHGVSSIGINEGHKFPFMTDAPLEEIWTSLETKIIERYPYSENQSIAIFDLENDVRDAEINLNKGSLHMERPNVSFLKDEEDGDSNFLSQIAVWRAISDKIEEKGVYVDGLPDLFWINMRGLHGINDIYGSNSNPAAEAKELVVSSIKQMKEIFEEAYQNKTMVLLLTSDTAHTRRFRRSSELATDRNFATVYSENYPVFFNIFLWFTIAFIMAIIAISMATAGMDPGRDSIIYRMTSTRMKKDN